MNQRSDSNLRVLDFVRRAQIYTIKAQRMGILKSKMLLMRLKTAALWIWKDKTAFFCCPCCDRTCIDWVDYSPTYREVVCPNCESQPRHRALVLYLKTCTDFYTAPLSVLHIGPESFLRRRFSALSNLRYMTADLMRSSVDLKMDVTCMPFGDNSYDVILASHVLEHIEDDRAAMREVLRVLKPGGFAFLQVPLDSRQPKTLEDPAIRLPHERLRVYLQEDHVRLYGRDYFDRLVQAGFVIRIANLAASLPKDQVRRYGLWQAEDLIFGHKAVA
jgi:SAM-dependent methyltransferase